MASLFKRFTNSLFGKKKTRRHRKHHLPMMNPMPGSMRMPGSSGIAIIRIMSRRNNTKNKATRKQRRN